MDEKEAELRKFGPKGQWWHWCTENDQCKYIQKMCYYNNVYKRQRAASKRFSDEMQQL